MATSSAVCLSCSCSLTSIQIFASKKDFWHESVVWSVSTSKNVALSCLSQNL